MVFWLDLDSLSKLVTVLSQYTALTSRRIFHVHCFVEVLCSNSRIAFGFESVRHNF